MDYTLDSLMKLKSRKARAILGETLNQLLLTQAAIRRAGGLPKGPMGTRGRGLGYDNAYLNRLETEVGHRVQVLRAVFGEVEG